MIDKNLHFLSSLLQESDIQLIVRAESKLCPAEEMGLEYSREVNKPHSEDFEILIQINPKIVRDLTPLELVRVYEILRIIVIGTESSTFKFLLQDYNNLLRKRSFHQERYFYLNSLSDNQFAYEIDCILTPGTKSRRNFYRQLGSQYCNNSLTLEELFLKYFQLKLKRIWKTRKKRLVRHKGYRDHGSLGTGDRTLDRDIYSDVWIREKEEKRKKESLDFLKFLSGLGGWE